MRTPASAGSVASASAAAVPSKGPQGEEGGDFFILEAMNGMRLTAVFVGAYWGVE